MAKKGGGKAVKYSVKKSHVKAPKPKPAKMQAYMGHRKGMRGA